MIGQKCDFLSVHKKKTPPPRRPCFFLPIRTIFELNRRIQETNVLIKFHKYWAKNVSSRLPTPGGHVFPLITAIFKLVRDIHITNTHPWRPCFLPIQTNFELNCRIQETNLLTKFHEDWTKNVSSRLFTCFHQIHLEKTAPPPGGHVFPLITTIFKLVQNIHITNGLTKFHDDEAKHVTSRVKKTTPGGNFVLPIRTIFELNRHIQETHVLSKFHDDWTKNVTSRTIFELVRHINKTNVLTKFHDDRAKLVTSKVFTRNTAPPPGAWPNFELGRGIIVLTKFHEDLTINVASRVFTRQNVDDQTRMTDDGQKAITKAHNEHVVLR
ncbi:hypothetical protein DPMN_088467 [Dreissena polymorpha]|uniref:Uncharacterized protein n=1 Tax=Dreissena polymorpha TaxID=45954 RepID=A0A9D4KV41_DREPO|nr:hypothetical protein DPMN_088467 [Dreissena polymorpha]